VPARLAESSDHPGNTGMSRADALAIKAYLMRLPPVRAEIPAYPIRFPVNQRWGMFFWKLFNNSDRRFAADSSQPEAWNRGAYTNAELAALGNDAIGQFGFRQGRITPQQIEAAKTRASAP